MMKTVILALAVISGNYYLQGCHALVICLTKMCDEEYENRGNML